MTSFFCISPADLILVVILPSPRDLEIARLLGWYRIPLRYAPKVVAMDYLAFYQTAAFGERKWQIEYFAEARGHELVTRGELLHDEWDHPRAKEEYYKIQIGPLQLLPRPIKATGWKRVTFLYTTGENLLRAETLNDLVVSSEERKTLWQSLRERASQQENYRTTNELPAFDLDSTIIAELLGLKGNRGSR